MSRYPTSQKRALMEEKARLARELLGRGLTVQQVSLQLNCSKVFVRRIAKENAQTSAA
ncbi:MAG: hypothetical protein ACRDFS_07885 [Chloroflexota bacterium]